jgi:hypothetical protein
MRTIFLHGSTRPQRAKSRQSQQNNHEMADFCPDDSNWVVINNINTIYQHGVFMLSSMYRTLQLFRAAYASPDTVLAGSI